MAAVTLEQLDAVELRAELPLDAEEPRAELPAEPVEPELPFDAVDARLPVEPEEPVGGGGG